MGMPTQTQLNTVKMVAIEPESAVRVPDLLQVEVGEVDPDAAERPEDTIRSQHRIVSINRHPISMGSG